MANTTTTANMALELPIPAQQVGPTYAVNVNDAFTAIDSHDHSSGKGVPVPSAGISIDADLSFNNFGQTSIEFSRFHQKGSADTSSGHAGEVQNVAGDLVWINGSGASVQVTAGGTLNAAALGGFTGDYGGPGVTAAAKFTNATGLYEFFKDMTDYAIGAFSKLRLKANSISNILTLSPHASTSAYEYKFPQAVPAATKFMRMDVSGQTDADVAIDGTTLAISSGVMAVQVGAIKPAPVSSGTVAFWTTNSFNYSNITTVSVVSTGRSALLKVIPANSGDCRLHFPAGETAIFQILRNGTSIGATVKYYSYDAVQIVCFEVFDPSPTAGAITYTLQGKNLSNLNDVNLYAIQLVWVEL